MGADSEAEGSTELVRGAASGGLVDTSLRNIRDLTKVRRVSGRYVVTGRLLKYSTVRRGLMGLTQYLEWAPELKAS